MKTPTLAYTASEGGTCRSRTPSPTKSDGFADGHPLHTIATAIHYPFGGQYEDDMRSSIEPSLSLGHEFGSRVREAVASMYIESYAKAILVSVDTEYEHGNALLTNRAANSVRPAQGGCKSCVRSTGRRGGPGISIDIPLAHKDALSFASLHRNGAELGFRHTRLVASPHGWPQILGAGQGRVGLRP
jgi:hypothetical protein